jgi:predicted  nucleic acid-binding Zn-ribbon protein
MSDDPASKDGLRWEIRRSLIERLRIPWEAMGEMANQQRAEAAVQIRTMMDELEAWRQAMQKAERDISELRNALEIEKNAVDHLHTDRNNLRLEIDRMVDKLTAQRDAARRELDEIRRKEKP